MLMEILRRIRDRSHVHFLVEDSPNLCYLSPLEVDSVIGMTYSSPDRKDVSSGNLLEL